MHLDFLVKIPKSNVKIAYRKKVIQTMFIMNTIEFMTKLRKKLILKEQLYGKNLILTRQKCSQMKTISNTFPMRISLKALTELQEVAALESVHSL